MSHCYSYTRKKKVTIAYGAVASITPNNSGPSEDFDLPYHPDHARRTKTRQTVLALSLTGANLQPQNRGALPR